MYKNCLKTSSYLQTLYLYIGTYSQVVQKGVEHSGKDTLIIHSTIHLDTTKTTTKNGIIFGLTYLNAPEYWQCNVYNI